MTAAEERELLEELGVSSGPPTKQDHVLATRVSRLRRGGKIAQAALVLARAKVERVGASVDRQLGLAEVLERKLGVA